MGGLEPRRGGAEGVVGVDPSDALRAGKAQQFGGLLRVVFPRPDVVLFGEGNKTREDLLFAQPSGGEDGFDVRGSRFGFVERQPRRGVENAFLSHETAPRPGG